MTTTSFLYGSISFKGSCVSLSGVNIPHANSDDRYFILGLGRAPQPDDHVCIVRYRETQKSVSCIHAYRHGGWIHDLQTLENRNVSENDVFCVIASPLCTRRNEFSVHVGRVPLSQDELEKDIAAPISDIDIVYDIENDEPFINVKKVITDRNSIYGDVNCRTCVVDRNKFMHFVLKDGTSFESLYAGASQGYITGSYCPHHPSLAVMAGDKLDLWDFRVSSVQASRELDKFHQIRDIDYNPNSQHKIITASVDGCLRVFDTRKLQKALLIYTDIQSHWVNCVRFNPYHDQLVLTAGGDNAVNLWSMNTDNETAHSYLSDKGEIELHDTVGQNDVQAGHENRNSVNGLDNVYSVKSLDNLLFRTHRNLRKHLLKDDTHENTVTSISWDSSDAWVYASCGVDGRVIVHEVPAETKYNILL